MLRHTWTGASGRVWRLDGRRDLIMTRGGLRGLTQPDMEFYDRPRLGHGSRWDGWRVTERPVVWPLHTHGGPGNDPMAWLEQDRAFWADLHPGRVGTWSVTTPDGVTRTLQCRARGDGNLPIVRDPLRFGRLAYNVELDGAAFWIGEPVTRTWGSDTSTGSWLVEPGHPDPDAVMEFGQGQTFGSATVTNAGDVEAWPTWTITGPCSMWTVGVGDQAITSNAPLADGEQRVVRTDGGGVYVTTASGANRFSELGVAKAAAIPDGASVGVDINLVGTGSIRLEFEPRFLRAY